MICIIYYYAKRSTSIFKFALKLKSFPIKVVLVLFVAYCDYKN